MLLINLCNGGILHFSFYFINGSHTIHASDHLIHNYAEPLKLSKCCESNYLINPLKKLHSLPHEDLFLMHNVTFWKIPKYKIPMYKYAIVVQP